MSKFFGKMICADFPLVSNNSSDPHQAKRLFLRAAESVYDFNLPADDYDNLFYENEYDNGIIFVKWLEGIYDFSIHLRFYAVPHVTLEKVSEICNILKKQGTDASVCSDLESEESKQAYNDFLRDFAKAHSEIGKGNLCIRLFCPASGGIICRDGHQIYSDGPCDNKTGNAYLHCIDYRCTDGNLDDFK